MIETAFLIAFNVLFLHASTWDGMINEWVRSMAFNWPVWVKKPLFDCPICMAPWWGALIMLTFHFATGFWKKILRIILMLFAAGGINTVLIYMISSDKEEVKALKDDD